VNSEEDNLTALLIVPTYNELENLPRLVEKLRAARDEEAFDVVFVDDNSPDGTGRLASDLSAEHTWISVIHRPNKYGLGRAYVAGFAYGLAQGYDLLLEMDADLSHDPAVIPRLIHAAGDADLVLGSRYVNGGGVDDWGLARRLISRGGSLYSRLLLGMPVRDFTGAFKCFRRVVLESVNLDDITSNGYCFQIEMTYRAIQQGFRVVEIPIVFHDRQAGRSKMSRRIVLEAIVRVWQLRNEKPGRPEARPAAPLGNGIDRVLDVRPAPAMFAMVPGGTGNGHLSCSIGVMAHNEEATIGKVLDALLAQELQTVRVPEIFVVASGCTDGTLDEVRRRAATDGRIRLLIQERREGKASAVNLFLHNMSSAIGLVIGGDTVPSPTLVEKLISPMTDPAVGMSGGRPVPLNDSRSFFGFAAHMLWNLHHKLALQSPKCGEAIAFRKVFSIIPSDTAVDELSIEALITRAGLKIRYVPDAVLYNRGPDNIHDFLNQRRRIYAGHLRVKSDSHYEASTMDGKRILRTWLSELGADPKEIIWGAGVAAMEAYSRILGSYDFHRKKSHHVWTVVESTKQVTKGIRSGRTLDNCDSVISVCVRDYPGFEARCGRKQAQNAVSRLANALTHDLREGRIVKILPGKGLVILTADAEPEEVEAVLSRTVRMLSIDVNGQVGFPAFGLWDLSYGLFSLDGHSGGATVPSYPMQLPLAIESAGIGAQVEM
jgi:poly-beta-1,6-N-acetyl-D-glucosamine synthase